MSLKILVTGANGDIGEAVGRILKSSFADARIEGSDCSGRWPGAAEFSTMHTLPRADHAGYVEELRALSARCSFDAIIPTSEPELARLVSDWRDVSELPLVMSRPDIVRIFLDKLDTARWLEQKGLNPPHTTTLEECEPVDLPVIVKPRRGAGGRGQEIVRTAARLRVMQAESDAGMVAQNLIDVEASEYTCAILEHDGDARFLTMWRRLGGDRTVEARVEEVPAISAALQTVARLAAPGGPLNVQLRLQNGEPRIFEINPRFSSTVMMRHQMGFEDVVWAVRRKTRSEPPPAFLAPVGMTSYRLARELVVARQDLA